MTARGGITMATTDITTAAVTEYSRTTHQATMMRARHVPIIRKYQRFRVNGLP
jgi:hypothetical protein